MSKKTFSDEELSRAFQAYVRRTPASTDGPDAERIWDTVRLKLPAEERRRVIDEIAQKPSSMALWTIAEDALLPEDRVSAVHKDDSASEMPRSIFAGFFELHWMWRLTSATAAIAAACALVFLTVDRPPSFDIEPGEPSYREPTRDVDGIRSLLPSRVVLPRQSVELKWQTDRKAKSYSVTVTNEEGTALLTRTGLTETSLSVPSDSLDSIPNGGRVFWTVTAETSQGGEVKSRPFVVVIE